MKKDSPEWLVMNQAELKGIKIPKEYAEYMYALWNVSRGIPFRLHYTPKYWRSLQPKKKVYNYLRKIGLRYKEKKKPLTSYYRS